MYARQNNYAATILEMNDSPGGQLTAWKRQDYQFDFCLQWLVGSKSGIYHDIYKEIGAMNDTTQVVNHDVFLKMTDKQHGDFYVYTDMDKWECYLKELAPEDAKGIHKLINIIKRASRMNAGGFENPPGMRSFWEYLRLMFGNPRLLSTMMKYSKRTNEELLDDLNINNQKLRYFLTKFGASSQPNHTWPALVL